MSVNDDEGPEPTRSGRRGDTFLSVARAFWRLWGFLLFLGFVVFWFREVALPFVFGMLIAYLLAPSVRRLEPRIGRAGAVIASYVVLLAALGGFMGVLLPALADDLSRFRDTAPDLIDRVNREWLPRASQWLDDSFNKLETPDDEIAAEPELPPGIEVVPQPDGSYRVSLEDVRLQVGEGPNGGWIIEPPKGEEGGLGDALKRFVASKSEELTGWIAGGIQSIVTGAASFVTRFFLTFMIAAFLLVDLARVRSFTRAMVPPGARGDFDHLLRAVDRGMSGVIRGQLMICAVNGALTYVGLLIFGVKYSLMLGITAAVFSLIPIFGTIISSIPILLIALVGDPTAGLGKMLGVLLWIGGIHLVEANFLNPKIIGESAHIHPVVVVFALLAGESVYGLTGALLAVPTASIIQTIFMYTRQQRDARWGTVDGETPSGAPVDAGDD